MFNLDDIGRKKENNIIQMPDYLKIILMNEVLNLEKQMHYLN